MTYPTLGERIKFLREQCGLTRSEVMKTLSIHNLGRFEANERFPSAQVLIVLSNFFNVSIDWLLTGKEPCEKKVITASLELTAEEVHFIDLLRLLPQNERIKIEGMIELKLVECQKAVLPNLSTSMNGNVKKAITRDLA